MKTWAAPKCRPKRYRDLRRYLARIKGVYSWGYDVRLWEKGPSGRELSATIPLIPGQVTFEGRRPKGGGPAATVWTWTEDRDGAGFHRIHVRFLGM